MKILEQYFHVILSLAGRFRQFLNQIENTNEPMTFNGINVIYLPRGIQLFSIEVVMTTIMIFYLPIDIIRF